MPHPHTWLKAQFLAMRSILMFTQLSPDIILLGGLVLLLAAGILTPQEAFSGVSNPGVITVQLLCFSGLPQPCTRLEVIGLFGAPPIGQTKVIDVSKSADYVPCCCRQCVPK